MEDFDRELFNSPLKKISTSSSLAKAPKSDIGFDEDDPLGDILSSSGETTPVKSSYHKASTKETPEISRQQSKSKLIADLFGLNEKEEVNNTISAFPATKDAKALNKVENPGDWLGLKAETFLDQEDHPDQQEKYLQSTQKKRHPMLKENSKEDDFVSTLNARDSIQTTSTSKDLTKSTYDEYSSKASLPAPRRNSGGIPETRKTSSILSSFISDFDSKPVLPIEASVMKGGGIDQGNKNSYTLSASREPRRNTRRRGGDIADPLGLFSSSNKSHQVDTNETQKTKEVEPTTAPLPATKEPPVSNADQVPLWLGGTTNLPAPSLSVPSNQTVNAANDNLTSTVEPKPSAQNDIDILTRLSNLEAQAGQAATLQQKSTITALALKRQEDELLKLQTQQATLLEQHEQQLGALVQRQLQRQQQMMRQQEQIQAHIQALMVQPPAIAPISLPSMLWSTEESSRYNSDSQMIIQTSRNQMEKDTEIIADLKGQVQRLATEKQEIKAQLEIEKQRHDNHLADMETLFRRQLAVQEEAMAKQEKRYLSEIDGLQMEATSRITRLKDEYGLASTQQSQRMAQLHGEWLADLQRLGEFHQQAVEMLRSEQTSAIEHWKNLQVAEIAAVKEASSNARFLDAAVSHLQESTASLTELKDQIKKEAMSQYSEKQESLLKQQVQLNALREALEKQAAALDSERLCLSTMTRDLESRLHRQQQEVNEEKSRFEAREKAWEREKLGAIELLNQEKRHLEKLQLEAHAELNELGERKLALAADVARLETTLHIQSSNANQNSHQAEQMVAEARSTLEAAQEAGKEVQREREEIISLKHSLTAELKRLNSLEREIQAREQRLEEETIRAKAFREEGVSALDEARRLERERTEHSSDLAQRLLHLKQREDRLAEEKLAITMEWKKIQESRDNITCSQCGQPTAATFSYFTNENIVDPLPIIMKLEAEQGLDFVTLDHPRYHSSLLESVSQ